MTQIIWQQIFDAGPGAGGGKAFLDRLNRIIFPIGKQPLTCCPVISQDLEDGWCLPKEVAEILGVDRKAVVRLTDKRIIGYYQFGPRTRRIGLRALRKYFSQIQDKAERIGKEKRAALRKEGRKTIAFLKKSRLAYDASLTRLIETAVTLGS